MSDLTPTPVERPLRCPENRDVLAFLCDVRGVLQSCTVALSKLHDALREMEQPAGPVFVHELTEVVDHHGRALCSLVGELKQATG